MARMRWIRLWTQETLYGTTNRELSLEERAIWFELLALAGDSPVPGIICVSPNVSFTDAQLSQILSAPEDLVRLTVRKLASPEVNKITLNNSLISIKNWEKYQSSFDKTEYQAEYMRSYRKRKSNAGESNAGESKQQKGTEGRGREQKRKESPPPPPTAAPPSPPTAAAGLDERFKRVATAYENEIGLLTPTIGDKLTEAIEAYSLDWIIEALSLAAAANARRWSYAEAILKRWKAEGKDNGAKPQKGGSDGKNREVTEDSVSKLLRAAKRYEETGRY